MFNIKNFSLFCLFFAVLIAPLLADFQTFKSDSGATIEAELIELGKSGKTVDIRLRNGNKISADLSSFSSEDQSKIKEWWRDTQAEKQVLSHESRIDINAKMNRKSRDNKYNGYYHTDDQTKSYFPVVVIKNSKGEITHFRATKAKYISNMKLIYECEAGQIYDESVSRKLNVSPNSYFVR